MALFFGQRLGPYEIEAPLGTGGMGEVYRCRDTRLDRLVALKVLRAREAADPHFRQVVTSAGMGAAAAIQATRFLEATEAPAEREPESSGEM